MGSSSRSLKSSECLVLGRVGTAFGVKGWLHLYSFAEQPEDLLNYRPWFLRRAVKNSALVPVQITQAKAHGDHFVFKFEGCDDRDVALTWTHAEVLVEKSQLPALEEGVYYLSDLLGLEVFNTQNQYLGEITDFFETGANDVLVVKQPTGPESKPEDAPKNAQNLKPSVPKDILIPYVPDQYILEVDLDKGKMIVDWEEDY